MNSKLDLDLVLLDFGPEHGVQSELAVHKLLALLLDETNLAARIEFLYQLSELGPCPESGYQPVAAESRPDLEDVIRVFLEVNPFLALEQERLTVAQLDAFSRDPVALRRAAELLTSEPEAGALPRPVAEDTDHGPTNFTKLAIQRRWPELQERLRPFLPELIQFVGLKGASSEDLLRFLLERARGAEVGPLRFRELLPGWLKKYAERTGLSPPRPLRPEDWVTFIDRAAVRLVLDEVPDGEPEWARMFRHHARDAKSWQEIAQLVPSEPPQPDALHRFRRSLVDQIRQVHQQAARAFELSSAA